MLTDKAILEIAEQLTWYDADVERIDPMQFARAIEAKIEAKLREQKPAIYQWTLKRDGFTQYTHHPNNQAEFSGWDVKPLYEHPAPSAEYPLPDDLYPSSKDWIAGGYKQRVEWLHLMYEGKKAELNLYLDQAPSAPDVDDLAQYIRAIDGNKTLAACALAECIIEHFYAAARSE